MTYEQERDSKIIAALVRAGYEVARLVNVIDAQERDEHTEAWFITADGDGDWAYLKPWGSTFKVVRDP